MLDGKQISPRDRTPTRQDESKPELSETRPGPDHIHRIQTLADSSARVSSLAGLQSRADSSARVSSLAGLQSRADAVVQRMELPVPVAEPEPMPESATAKVDKLFAGGDPGEQPHPLPHLSTIQASFGPYDISGVRAHSSSTAQALNQQQDSAAMTKGEHVALGSRSTPLHVVAHEAAHVLQHRSGLRLSGGIGSSGDRHEDFADEVAAHVSTGQSVHGLLDRTVGTAARRPGSPRSDAPLQMFSNVNFFRSQLVRDRIKKRGGEGVSVGIKDDFYTGDTDTALVANDVASMAADPIFEMAAIRFETGLGSLAYNHSKTKQVCKKAGAKVLAYFDAKYALSRSKTQEIDEALSSMGIADPGWSGAVGKSARLVREVLTKGSVNEQVAHIETFVKDILAFDVMENDSSWRDHARTAGYDLDQLEQGYRNVAFTGDRYLLFDTSEDGATGMQWHTRAKVEDVRKKTKRSDRFHPSTVKAPPVKAPEVPETVEDSVDSPKLELAPQPPPKKKAVKGGDESVTTRDLDRIEQSGPLGLGIELGTHEKAFQERKTKDPKKLAWVEGARVFALNELDSWVYAQRQLSLPLVAGTSSTAARIMQSFRFLGVGPADDARLAAIAAMLVGRHHSLVEVMEAGKRYGTSPYREGPLMYHDLAPLTDEEIRKSGLEYPDEYVASSRRMRGGYRPPLEPVEPKSKSAGLALALRRPQQRAPGRPEGYDQEIANLTARGRPTAFTRTRATIKSQLGISNFFTDHNSAQARMLKAVDAYHAAIQLPAKLAQLEKVRMEADKWLVKHPDWMLGKSRATRNKFKLIRDEAAAVLQTYQDQDDAAYLADLQSDRMIASSEHVGQAMNVLRDSRGDNPYGAAAVVARYGLTLAELAAIKVYCGPAYKYINPALEDDRAVMNNRLLGFVREIKLAENNNKSAKERIREAEAARGKLVRIDNPISAAMAEGQRHAAIAIRGLAKLPPFTGQVFAGGAVPRHEAMRRFRTGDVQLRKSFASTSAQEFTASGFATSKGDKLQEAYDSIPERERDPKNAPFPFMLRYTSRTGRDIADLSVDPGEKEVLFAPGTKLRITRGADSPTAETKGYGGEIYYTYIDAVEVP